MRQNIFPSPTLLARGLLFSLTLSHIALRCAADDKAPVSLIPAKDYATRFLARPYDSFSTSDKGERFSNYDYKAQMVDGKLYFEGPTYRRDPTNLNALEKIAKVDQVKIDLIQSARGLSIGYRADGPNRANDPLRYLAIDWTADPPAVTFVEKLEQACVWTWESREGKAETGHHEKYVFPQSSFFVTRNPQKRVYYLSLERKPLWRVEEQYGKVVCLWRPIVTSEELWSFQLNLLFSELPEPKALQAARERDLPTPEDASRNDAGSWTPKELYSEKYRSYLALEGPSTAEGRGYVGGLLFLDGQPMFSCEYEPGFVGPLPRSDDFIPAAHPNDILTSVRLFMEAKDGGFRIGGKMRFGVGYRFLAVDWSSKPHRVIVTRNPDEAAVWRFPELTVSKDQGEGSHDGNFLHSGALSTKDKDGADFFLDIDPTHVVLPGDRFNSALILHAAIVVPKTEKSVVYRASLPRKYDGK